MTYDYKALERGDRMIDAAQRLNKFEIETILPEIRGPNGALRRPETGVLEYQRCFGKRTKEIKPQQRSQGT